MIIKITDGGVFAHPNPKFRARPHLRLATGWVGEVDEEQGDFLIGLNRAERLADREYEVRRPEVVEQPPEPEVEETPKKKRRGRRAGQKRKL